MKISFLIILLILVGINSFSQDNNKVSKDFARDFVEADDLMGDNNYNAALKLLLNLLETDADNGNIQNKIGLCYLKTALEKEKAIGYFEKAITHSGQKVKTESPEERRAPLEAYYNLGKAYHANYKFKDAINLYNGYLDKIVEVPNNDTLVEKANREIDICKSAMELVKHPIQMKVENLGSAINSPYADYSPFVNADESMIIFTSKREGSTGGMQSDDGNFMEDIYISYKDKNGKWAKAENISPNINTNGHDASCGLSVDGQELFIFRDDKDKGDIYSSKLSGNDWSVAQSLGTFVNTKYYEKGASMSANGNFLFFSSDRPDGYGGFDIYMSKKLPNGQWGEAFNLGPNINTEYDEIGPFFHPDASTLYFASEGHNTMGGFDLFYSNINIEEGTSSIPKNIGYPINTVGDDVFICITPDSKRAYYSSFQKDGLGYTDIYMITLEEPINKSLTVLSGVVKKEGAGNCSDVQVSVTDPDTQDLIGLYAPNTKTGKYIMIVNAGKRYTAQYECDGYNTVIKTTEISKDSTYLQTTKVFNLDTIYLKKPSYNCHLFFDRKSAQLNEEAKKELNNAIQFLEKDQTSPVIVSSRAGGDNKLDKKRKLAIKDYLAKNNIKDRRIQNDTTEINSTNVCMIQFSEKEEKKQLAEKSNTEELTNAEKIESKTEDTPDKNAARVNLSDVKKLEKGMLINLNNILFPINKSYITEQAYVEINKLLNFMEQNQKLVIEISGHTDITGPQRFNDKLSFQRAKGVADYLFIKGIEKKRITYKGYGSKLPMVSNDTEDSKKLNRRVEFRVVSF